MMEILIHTHGEDRVFFGAKPAKIVDCYKQIVLALGHSPQDFAANQRKGHKIKTSKKEPCGLNETSPISEPFHHRLAIQAGAGMERTLHKVENFSTNKRSM